jgi:4-hydroxy 2-oxovalerate aldolase
LNARGDISNEGSWSAKAWCQDKEVLILGSGIDLQTYKQGIIQYIDNFNPVVMSLNVKHDFPENLINVYVSSNESKMLSEHEMYSTLNKPLAVSKVLLNKVTGKSLNIKELWDYGLNIKKNTFTIDEKECSLPYELSIGYALSLANIGGANNISLVGFNGYNKNDIRQIKMDELFKLYNRSGLVPVLALTPTNYQLEQGSIYAEKY